MSGEKFRLVLSGNLVDGFDRNDVEEVLAQLMHLPLEQVQRLLQGKVSKIPRKLNLEKAERLCKKLNTCGVECRIEPIVRKIANREDAETTISPAPSVDDAVDADNPVWTEEDILQPTPDEMEMVDSLDLDLPVVHVSMPQGAQSIVVEPAPGDWTDRADTVDEEDDDEDSGQFFEYPNTTQELAGNSIKSLFLSNKKFQLALGGLSLMMLLALFYLFIDDSGSNAVSVQKQPEVKTRNNQAAADPELALTREHVEGLSRQVKVWMLEYGSSDPMLVTLARLEQDLEISAKEMVDGWGMPLRFEPAERSYVIRSAGPDKSFLTKDDLVKKTEMY